MTHAPDAPTPGGADRRHLPPPCPPRASPCRLLRLCSAPRHCCGGLGHGSVSSSSTPRSAATVAPPPHRHSALSRTCRRGCSLMMTARGYRTTTTPTPGKWCGSHSATFTPWGGRASPLHRCAQRMARRRPLQWRRRGQGKGRKRPRHGRLGAVAEPTARALLRTVRRRRLRGLGRCPVVPRLPLRRCGGAAESSSACTQTKPLAQSSRPRCVTASRSPWCRAACSRQSFQSVCCAWARMEGRRCKCDRASSSASGWRPCTRASASSWCRGSRPRATPWCTARSTTTTAALAATLQAPMCPAPQTRSEPRGAVPFVAVRDAATRALARDRYESGKSRRGTGTGGHARHSSRRPACSRGPRQQTAGKPNPVQPRGRGVVVVGPGPNCNSVSEVGDLPLVLLVL